jgi:hypothetical protein
LQPVDSCSWMILPFGPVNLSHREYRYRGHLVKTFYAIII